MKLTHDIEQIFIKLNENRDAHNRYHTLVDALRTALDIVVDDMKREHRVIDTVIQTRSMLVNLEDVEYLEEVKDLLSKEIKSLEIKKSIVLDQEDFRAYHKLLNAYQKLLHMNSKVIRTLN